MLHPFSFVKMSSNPLTVAMHVPMPDDGSSLPTRLITRFTSFGQVPVLITRFRALSGPASYDQSDLPVTMIIVTSVHKQ